ncbi:neprilysin-2-like isoform X2 [Ornithodoros turicata]|uniref:neprilysin-2-like isoform X2 n=1 Tax=Ornithodoros turicata TaxID=34597 RepID=UPI003139BB9B
MYPSFPPRYLPMKTRSLPADAGLCPETKHSSSAGSTTSMVPGITGTSTAQSRGDNSGESSRSTVRLDDGDGDGYPRAGPKRRVFIMGSVVVFLACMLAVFASTLRVGIGSESHKEPARPSPRSSVKEPSSLPTAASRKTSDFYFNNTSATSETRAGNLFHMVLSRTLTTTSPRVTAGRKWNVSTCWSEACMEEAASIRAATELALDPCDDFYAYACSRWTHARPLPSGHAVSSVDDDLLDVFTLDIFNALTKPSPQPVYEQLRSLLLSCAISGDEDFRALARSALVTAGLDRWPYDGAGNFSISATIGRMIRDFSFDPLFGLREVPDPASSTGFRRAYAFTGPAPIINEGWQDNWDYTFIRLAYEEIVDALDEKSLYDPLETERQLVLAVDKTPNDIAVKLRNCTRSSVSELPNLDFISWDELFSQLTAGNQLDINETTVLLPDPSLFKRFNESMLLRGQSSKTKMANYLGFRILLLLSPFATTADDANSPASLAYARHTSYPFSLNEYETCIRFMDKVEPVIAMRRLREDAPQVVSKLGDRRDVNDLVNFLRKELKACLMSSSLLFTAVTADVVRRLLAFLDDVAWQVFEPDLLEHSWTFKKLVAAYTQLKASKTGLLDFIRTTSQLRRESTSDVLAAHWWGGILRTTANLPFPSRVLEIPFPVFNFQKSSDVSVRHLRIPRVAPRIYRAVYKALYVASSNMALENVTWSPLQFFDDTADCLADQYAGMQWKQGNTSDSVTATRRSYSDLFDALALGSATDAYSAYVSEKQKTYRLNGLQLYDSTQVFFIEYARNLCEVSDPRYVEALLQRSEDSSSPAWYTVNGPLMNTWEFARAFSCRSGTFMNPIHKCPLVRKRR